jgi:hypothetical protein
MRMQLFILAIATLSAGLTDTASAQTTVDCDERQKGIIASAQYYTGIGLLLAGDYLDSVREGGDDTRFRTWIGLSDDEELNAEIIDRVAETLEYVYQGIDDITYACDCMIPGTNAFVRTPDPTFQIHMCTRYFDVFEMGDMQMSTIIHEISHWRGTRDCTKPESEGACCYGTPSDPPECMGADPTPNSPDAAQDLAADDPVTASNNAYNIAWFVTEGT